MHKPPKKKQQKLREKISFKNSLDVGMNLKKGWKQGQDENTQEDYSTTEIWWKRKDTKSTLHLLLVHATDAG